MIPRTGHLLVALVALLTAAASRATSVQEGSTADDEAPTQTADDAAEEAGGGEDDEGEWYSLERLKKLIPERKAPHEDDPNKHRFVPVLVPTLTYNTDEGMGFGATTTLFHYHGGRKPFRDDLSLVLYVTTKLVQRYEVRWEGIDVFNTPVRVYFRGGYYSTVSQNYCGFGMGVRCSVDEAEQAADRRGLTTGSEERDAFLRHFYQLRYIRPYVDTTARFKVWSMPRLKVELLGGLRASYYIPGQIGDLGPYPGSLYSRGFEKGEPGLSSVLMGGVVFDRRDNEPAPTHGYLVEASVRGATPFWGSKWTYAGANASAAGYVTVLRKPELVLAARFLADVIYGNAPTEEIATTGGLRVQPTFGGMWMGRGIRQHRYIGKIKFIEQLELRSGFWRVRVPVLNFEFGLGAAGFIDAAWIGADWNDLAGGIPGQADDHLDQGNLSGLLYTVGGGLRILINDTLVVRIDVGYSPFEQRGLGLYMPVGNAF